ncbi:PIR protein, putative [Plasmodium sp. gorilla clade G1]|nr:PIR protein, putative [Plasmodium sp. gorilla clade G1]
MKIHYTKIILFSLALNILLSSSCAHNKNKPYITSHTRNTTSRVLSECDVHTSIYDNDPDMKSVKENFNRQASQRFEEYEKLMIIKRQKCKEQCDKDIEQIIVKDKMQKSLAQKVEKGCLMCGCGLGGGVLPVWGLVSGLWYATWSQYVATTLVKMATDKGIKKGLEVGLVKVTEIVKQLFRLQEAQVPSVDMLSNMTTGTFTNDVSLFGIFKAINSAMEGKLDIGTYAGFSSGVQTIAQKTALPNSYSTQAKAVITAFNEAKEGVLAGGAQATSSLTTAIIVSFVAIVIIVLLMLIIYLILRYRRKKKINKKQQYTKLLKA